MVVHVKYQQHLWKKFFKMLLIFLMYQGKGKGKSIPHRPVTGPEDYRKLRLLNFMRIDKMKVVRVLALSTGRLYSSANIPGTHFCYKTSLLQNHRRAGRTMSMKNSKYTIWKRIRDLPPCSAVLNQPLCNPISYTPIVRIVYVTKDMSMKKKNKFRNQ